MGMEGGTGERESGEGWWKVVNWLIEMVSQLHGEERGGGDGQLAD